MEAVAPSDKGWYVPALQLPEYEISELFARMSVYVVAILLVLRGFQMMNELDKGPSSVMRLSEQRFSVQFKGPPAADEDVSSRLAAWRPVGQKMIP